MSRLDLHLDMSQYQPGVCNIGRDERRKRRMAGMASLGGALAVVGYVLVSGRPDGQVLLAFPLFFGAAIGFVQDRLRFCVAFGALARYDLAGSGGGAGSIAEREAVRRDRKRAVQVAGVALSVALAATALVYAVAVLSV